METTNALLLVGVDRAYGHREALRSVSAELPVGRVAALVGRNGAGKTTLLHTVVGLARPDRGRVLVFGKPPRAALADGDVGFVAQEKPVFPRILGHRKRASSMTWLMWRQHRHHLTVVLALLAAMAGGYLILRGALEHYLTTSGLTDCLRLPDEGCGHAVGGLRDVHPGLVDDIVYLTFLPVLAGLFIGAPLVAAETEHGTHRFVWTQAVVSCPRSATSSPATSCWPRRSPRAWSPGTRPPPRGRRGAWRS